MSFISRLRRSRQHRVSILSAYLVHPFPLRGTSPRWEACHWIFRSLRSLTNPVPLPPQGETRALRDWLSVSYSMISVLVISRYAAPPYPAAPDFLHGKACHTILRSLCSLTNRVPLPPHPGDRIKRSMLSCRDMIPLLSIHSATVHILHRMCKSGKVRRLACPLRRFPFICPTELRGKGGGVSHQRGNRRSDTRSI